jgi:hypothetical protein
MFRYAWVMARRLLRLMVVAALAAVGAHSAVACNKADFVDRDNSGCREAKCTCDEDPSQPTCKGFNERGETGPLDPVDAVAPFDAAEASTVDDAAADGAGPEDAGDEGG